MQNKLVVVGYTGIKRAYLNITKEEAIKRYANHNNLLECEIDLVDDVEEFEFEDEFGVYDAWR